MVKKEQFVLIALLPLLSACGSDLGSSDQSQRTAPENPQGTATQPLPPVPDSASAGNGAGQGNDRGQQAKPKFRRGGLLVRSAGTQAPPDPYLAQYDKSRLGKAATIHHWLNVQMSSGLEALLWTRWVKGVAHIRVGVIGPRDQLVHFKGEHEALIVHLQDSTCNSIKMATVPLNMLKDESPGAKGEIAKIFSEGQLECSLEDYERIRQWIVEWN